MTVKSFLTILTNNHDSDYSAQPMYQKIKEHILEKIADREWLANQKLPSENEIAGELGISRMTVNRAFKELTEEGYLFREKGAGTFVAEPVPLIPFFELLPISEELAIEGNPYHCQILQLNSLQYLQTLADEKSELISHQLEDQILQNEEIEQFLISPAWYSEVLYGNSQAPIQLEQRYVLESFAPKYLKQSFSKDCTMIYLQQLSPILTKKHILTAIIPDEKLQNFLKLGNGEACFKIMESLYLKHQLVSYAEQYYPASRYQFHSNV